MIWMILTLISAIPVGYLISWMARDELVAGEKWFRALIILFSVIGIASFAFGYYVISWTSAFIAILALISFIKAGDKKWTRKTS